MTLRMVPLKILRCSICVLIPLSLLESAEPYVPNVDISIESPWRWNELESLEGFGARRAAEAPDGAIWLARGNSVMRYDGRESKRFVLESVPEKAKVKDIHATKDGRIILSTNKSLSLWRDGKWMSLSDESSNWRLLNCISESESGNVWVSINSSLIRIGEDETERFELGLGLIGATSIDNEGRLWVTHSQQGQISVYDIQDGAPQLYKTIDLGIGIEALGNLFLDSDGRTWFFYHSEGVSIFVLKDYVVESVKTGLAMRGLNSEPKSIVEVPRGTMWFCSARLLGEYRDGQLKVHRVDDLQLPTSYPFAINLSGDRLLIGGNASKTFIVDFSDQHWVTFKDLNFQCQSEDGSYWFIHHDGRVIRQGNDKGPWIALGVDDGLPELPNRIFESSDGTIWVSGRHGNVAAVSYLHDGAWTRETFPGLGSIISHLGVAESTDGSVLFGAGTPPSALDNRKGGAIVFRKDAGRMVGTHVMPPIFPVRTANIVERQGDGFYFGALSLTSRLGNGSLSPKKIERFEDSWIDHLDIDGENNLWAALWGSGVYRFDGNEWVEFNESNGLESNRVVCLLAGRYGPGIWAGTDRGLSRFDGKSWTNWNLPKEMTFFRESNTLREGRDGTLWLNYSYRDRFFRGNLDSSQANTYRTIRYRADRQAPETQIVEFHDKVLEGAAASFSLEGKDAWTRNGSNDLEFSHRINGGEWSPFSRERKVVVADLKGGLHHFEVRARDLDWNVDSTPASAEFQIIPPLWKRSWFILIVLVTGCLLVYLANALFKARIQSAMAMEKFKLEFFTSISHELRNPLAVILGPLERLLSTEKNPEDRNLLKIALSNARKMQGMIDQLLQFRKFELKNSRFRPVKGEIISFMRDAVEAMAPLWKQKQQDVSIEMAIEYLECEFDADKLQKILDNLLSNAIKYTPEGGSINVSFRLDSIHDDLYGLLSVSDSGVGIPQHSIDHVIEPFYRVNGSRDSEKGFGIGLALVNQLVNLWGGELSIESPTCDGTHGTRVSVKLPLMERPDEDADFEDEVEEEAGEENQSRKRLLLVEDNQDFRHFMKSELSNKFDILEASDGLKGLEVAIRANPDLIVSDVMMPGMDGFELCSQIRSKMETSHIPVILLTAKSAEEHSVEGIKAGADAYFAKPLKMDRLQARIEQLLLTRSQLRERFSQQLVVEPTELTVSSTEEAILRRAIEVVENNMANYEFSVEQFSKEMAMSRTTLYRKLKALTGQGPNPFVRTMRMKRAAQLLKSGKITISETLEHVGFLDLSYFSRVFKSEFGVSPSDYQHNAIQEQKSTISSD